MNNDGYFPLSAAETNVKYKNLSDAIRHVGEIAYRGDDTDVKLALGAIHSALEMMQDLMSLSGMPRTGPRGSGPSQP